MTAKIIQPWVEALRLLAHRLVAQQNPYVNFSDESRNFIKTIAGSETLKARARAIRDELAQVVVAALCESVWRDPDDPAAHLAAGLLLSTGSVALIQAHQTYHRGRNATDAEAVFLAFVDKGTLGAKAALEGTPYA